jgi:hypothetical protein
VRFVLVESAADKETSAARSLRLQAGTALDQRTGFVRVGETPRGVLWRMEAAPAAREGLTAGQRATAQLVVTIELIVLLAALLLSIPTRSSRRAARAVPRAVGVLPERAPRPVKPERERRARPRRKPKAAPESLVIPAVADAGSADPAGETRDEQSAPSADATAAPEPEAEPTTSAEAALDAEGTDGIEPPEPAAEADVEDAAEPRTGSAPAKEADE